MSEVNAISRKVNRYVFAVAFIAMAAAVGLSGVHPWGDLRTASGASILTAEGASGEVRTLLEKKCGDCHSNNTSWPLYSRVAPVSWLVEHDVADGRKHLNFSAWESYGVDTRIDLLGKVATQVRQSKMPLPGYLVLHPEARLSETERKLIVDWSKAERRRLLAAESK